ncbi:MAG: hypothetical protein IPP79_05340 [Chitinophagaceae bacterium]|nr:hypothetical protein [Chitinophagaceae bacterium]
MLKIVLAVFILLHAMIHLMGFAKAFQFAELKQLTLPISKSMGLIWLITTLVFLMAIVLLFFKQKPMDITRRFRNYLISIPDYS